MSNPFLGQIMQVGFTFAPRGWALCQGQSLSIQQNTALFSLLGTTYGGNGTTTFNLPDFRGRVPVGTGNGAGLTPVVAGQQAGLEATSLSLSQLPIHNHTATFTNTNSSFSALTSKATQQTPAAGSQLARSVDANGSLPQIYAPASTANNVALAGLNVAGVVNVGLAGGSQPFSIRDPYLGITTIIALQGIFPSRS
jgi:microcystin-dependent protein